MSAPSAQTQRMSMEDWLERFSEAPFDYIDGQVIPWLPSPAGTAYTANLLQDALIEAEERGKLGLVYIGVALVYLDGDLIRTCLTPNLIFISNEREQAFRDQYPHTWKVLPLMAVPELAVEVISPSDRYADVNRKVKRYLDEGVGLVWVVDYLNHFVDVFTTHTTQRLYPSDTLTAGDLIPGFGLKLETLFP